MEDNLQEAYLYGAQNGAEYLKEIGQMDLSKLTPDQVLTFAECMCKNYHNKLIEISA